MVTQVNVRNRRMRVLHSLAPPDGTTKYVNQMVDGAPADVEILYFGWPFALRGDYDVLHIHWPELVIRDRSRARRFLKRQAMRILLIRLRQRRIPLVRTLHNLEPHESGSASERRLLRTVDRRTDLFIRLNQLTPAVDERRPPVTILHGHYRDRFASHPRSESRTGRLLYFGIIRPYKGVDRLLEVFRSTADPDLELRIVGKPTPELGRLIQDAVAADPRISSRPAFVGDDVLVREVSGAELVVLPYREMHNSGVALVALSLNRPILVPRTAANSVLADEVGPGWVIQYDGDLDGPTLRRGLEIVRGTGRGPRPQLAGRDWDSIGEQHRDAYWAVKREFGARPK